MHCDQSLVLFASLYVVLHKAGSGGARNPVEVHVTLEPAQLPTWTHCGSV